MRLRSLLTQRHRILSNEIGIKFNGNNEKTGHIKTGVTALR